MKTVLYRIQSIEAPEGEGFRYNSLRTLSDTKVNEEMHRYGTGNILRPNVSVEPLHQMGPQQLRPDLDTEKRCRDMNIKDM